MARTKADARNALEEAAGKKGNKKKNRLRRAAPTAEADATEEASPATPGCTSATAEAAEPQRRSKRLAPGDGETGGRDGAPVFKLKPGIKALREVRQYQGTTELLIRKIGFQRLVREMSKKLGPFRFEVQALLALQEAAEGYLTGLFEDAGLCALHGRRVTIMTRDLTLSKRIRTGDTPGARVASASFAGEATRVPHRDPKPRSKPDLQAGPVTPSQNGGAETPVAAGPPTPFGPTSGTETPRAPAPSGTENPGAPAPETPRAMGAATPAATVLESTAPEPASVSASQAETQAEPLDLDEM